MKRKPTVGPPPPPGAKSRPKRAKTSPKVDDDSAPFEEIDELAIEALDPNNRSGVLKHKRPKSQPRVEPPKPKPAPAPAPSRWVASARAIASRAPSVHTSGPRSAPEGSNDRSGFAGERGVSNDRSGFAGERGASIDATLESFDGPSVIEGQAFDTEDFGKIEPEASGSFEMSAEDIAALREAEPPLPRAPSLDRSGFAGPRSAPEGERGVIDRAESLAEEQLIAELPEVPVLRVAICETHGHLAAGQGAVAAAGHMLVVGAAGVDGATKVMDAMRRTDVDVVIVALPGAGDGRSGGVETQVIDAALALEPRRPIIVASVPGTAADGVRRAHQAGADLVTLRPHDVDRLAPVLMAAARLAYTRGRLADAHGTANVLRDKLESMSQPEGGLVALELFQRMLETEIKRARRYEYPLAVAMFAVDIDEPPPGVRGILRARIGNVLVRTIRDIDVATQLDHERFFVLLPYTDLSGATNLARRVIDSIRIGDAVVVGDRAYLPRVVGAVAGASPGQVMSFSKLVRDASRALDQARADGAELAVQP